MLVGYFKHYKSILRPKISLVGVFMGLVGVKNRLLADIEPNESKPYHYKIYEIFGKCNCIS